MSGRKKKSVALAYGLCLGGVAEGRRGRRHSGHTFVPNDHSVCAFAEIPEGRGRLIEQAAYAKLFLMNRDQVIATLRIHESELRAAGIVRLSLFGSTVRGEERAQSFSQTDEAIDSVKYALLIMSEAAQKLDTISIPAYRR